MRLRLMSFNIQHCANFNTGIIDYDAFADAIASEGADIIGLNEVRDTGPSDGYEAQAAILAKKLGFYYYFAKAIDVDARIRTAMRFCLAIRFSPARR